MADDKSVQGAAEKILGLLNPKLGQSAPVLKAEPSVEPEVKKEQPQEVSNDNQSQSDEIVEEAVTTENTTEEIKEERKEWEELAQAVLHYFVIDTSQAPYVFSELDLVFKTQEGTVEQQKEGDEIVHTLKLADSVRTMSPEVFVSMVKKDITQWAEGSGATNVTWLIEGKNLDVHAAQFAITEMASTDNFIVGDAKINVLPDQIFSITWRFTGGAEDDQITLSFSATDNGPVTTRGIEWTYAMQPNDASALATIRQVEDRILTKAYGTTGWQAPL